MKQMENRAMQINDFIQDYLSDKDEGLKALVTFFLNLVMQYEAEQQAGAGRYQRTETRNATRNGSKPRTFRTKLGELTLEKPEFRERSFDTVIFENTAGWNKPSSIRSWNRISRESRPERYVISWKNLESPVFQQRPYHISKNP
jgi:hypothetical protein